MRIFFIFIILNLFDNTFQDEETQEGNEVKKGTLSVNLEPTNETEAYGNEKKELEDLATTEKVTSEASNLTLDSETNNTSSDVDTVTIKTFVGAITGKKYSLGSTIYKFLGIPYAQPPIGTLRFKPPMPVARYYNLQAVEFGEECIQISLSGDLVGGEDCLFLNIYTSSVPINRTGEELKPVLFWIHGGAFVFGSSTGYDPTPLLKEDVIIVTVNYRLGGLGFLTFGNDIVSGNMGLRDQLEALQWTKRFIKYFGGDPGRITIFGESAGGMSVNALQLSPKSQGLISGAIAQSGTMLIAPSYQKSRQERNALAIASSFNCSSLNLDAAMLNCLQDIPAEEFVKNTKSSLIVVTADRESSYYKLGNWFPNQDVYSSDPVLPFDPLTALRTGHFNKVPLMTGTVKNDGALIFPREDFASVWNITGPSWLQIAQSSNKSEISDTEFTLANIILKYYNGGSFNLSETLNEYAKMQTDAIFLSPDQKLAQLASKHVPVYNYQLTYSGSNSYLPFIVGDLRKNFKEEHLSNLKPVHVDDTLYLFNVFGARNEKDEELSQLMVKYWTNFAKYGHPTPLMNDNLTTWKTYSHEKRYLELNLPPKMNKEIEKERMTFWQNMVWNQREVRVE